MSTSTQTIETTRQAPALEPPPWPGRKPPVPASLAVRRANRNTAQDRDVQVA